jgi:ABC-type transport system involved in cytochrome c biogenesis permease subunit
MRSSAAALAAALKRQPGYPPAAKLSLEANLERFAVLKIAFGLYALAAVLFVVWAALGRPRIGDAGAWAATAGFIFVTAALTGRWIIAGHLPVVGTYEIILLFSWAVVLCFIVFYLKTRGAFLGLVLMPVVVGLGVLASFFPSGVEAQVAPALRSGWFSLRGVLAVLGGGGFAVAFAAAALRLLRGGVASARFPSAEGLAALEYRAMSFGYPFFAVGVLAAGALWARQAAGAWWAWGRGDLALLVVLALATAYVHGRSVRGRRGNGAAALAVLTFVAAVLSLLAGALPGGGASSGL